MSDAEKTKEELGETAAAETIGTHPMGFSRADLMSMIVTDLSKKSHGDLSDWFLKQQATIGHEADEVPDGAAGKNQASVKMKGDAKAATIKAVREDFDAIFGGCEVSEETRQKLTTLFEAAVTARVAVEAARIEDEIEAEYVARFEDTAAEMQQKLEDYVDYAAEEWVKENEVAITESLKVELTEDFIRGLHGLFREHWIDVPEDKVDVLAKMQERIEDLEAELSEQTDSVIQARKESEKLTALRTFESVAADLTVVDQERFKTLVEDVEFSGDVEDLKKKLVLVKEQHFKPKDPKAGGDGIIREETVQVVDENGIAVDGTAVVETVTNPEMAKYIAATKRTQTQM